MLPSIGIIQMFESYGSEVYMSMSADSTCRGLRTTKDGPLVLKFTKGNIHVHFLRYLCNFWKCLSLINRQNNVEIQKDKV